MKRLLALGLLAFSYSHAHASAFKYKCDSEKELPTKVLSLKNEHDSEKYRTIYTGLYSDFDLSIKKICEYTNKCDKGDLEVREQYAKTRYGKKSIDEMEKIKFQFGYNAIDSYLFDDHELNSLGNLKVTHTFKKGDRTYYINDKKVVAYVDHFGEEGVLNRLADNCDISEIVVFSTLVDGDNPVRMKVTKNYCTSAQNKGPTFKHTDQDLQSMGAFFLNHDGVEDQMEAQELCEQWVPKPEPLGLVIDTNSAAPPPRKPKYKKRTKTKAAKVAATTSKSKKKSSKRPK